MATPGLENVELFSFASLETKHYGVKSGGKAMAVSKHIVGVMIRKCNEIEDD